MYVTVMFPYPSGDKLHAGHYYNYAIMDSYCNMLRYKGIDVFQPFGYDAFGLPAENYAKKVGRTPADVTEENINAFRKQMQNMNTMYEELAVTTTEEYKSYTQMVFTIIRSHCEESIEIKLNNITIANANHDMDGWHGMRKLEDLVIDIAKLLNIPINEIEECEEDDDE